jgi:hypothetical protein
MKEYIVTYKDWDGFEKNTVITANDRAEAYRKFKERYPLGNIISCETGQEGCTKYILIAIGTIIVLFLLLKGC